jgi:hypothetical protein
VVIAGAIVAEQGRVTVVHDPRPDALARRLARRARVRVLASPDGAAALAEELAAAAKVRALGVTTDDPAALAAALADDAADRALLAEHERLRDAPVAPADPDATLAHLAELAEAVRRARAAVANTRARLDAAAAAAGTTEVHPLARVDPEAARAAAERVAAATHRARLVQQRLNAVHADRRQDWSVVTAHQHYAAARRRFVRRTAVAAAVLAAGFALPGAAGAGDTASFAATAVAAVLAAGLFARALVRLRRNRAQLEHALFWAGLSHPDRLASRNLESQIAAVDINELRSAERALAEALRAWESLAGPGTDPADCDHLLAEAARQLEAGLPQAHDAWATARDVLASAELAWRALLAELALPALDADEVDRAMAEVRARVAATRRAADVEAAARAAEARMAARALLRSVVDAAPAPGEVLARLAAAAAAPPPSLVVVVDDGSATPEPAHGRALERLSEHAPVALVTRSLRRWGGIVGLDVDLRDEDPAAERAPERAWFASS